MIMCGDSALFGFMLSAIFTGWAQCAEGEKAIYKFTKVNVYESGKTRVSIRNSVPVLSQKFTKAANLQRSTLQKWAGGYIYFAFIMKNQ